jgi:hypothetical protein
LIALALAANLSFKISLFIVFYMKSKLEKTIAKFRKIPVRGLVLPLFFSGQGKPHRI